MIMDRENLIKHLLVVEAIMQGLVKHFGEDTEKWWGTAGLMHDIDIGKTRNSPKLHSLIGAEMLEKMGFPNNMFML